MKDRRCPIRPFHFHFRFPNRFIPAPFTVVNSLRRVIDCYCGIGRQTSGSLN